MVFDGAVWRMCLSDHSPVRRRWEVSAISACLRGGSSPANPVPLPSVFVRGRLGAYGVSQSDSRAHGPPQTMSTSRVAMRRLAASSVVDENPQLSDLASHVVYSVLAALFFLLTALAVFYFVRLVRRRDRSLLRSHLVFFAFISIGNLCTHPTVSLGSFLPPVITIQDPDDLLPIDGALRGSRGGGRGLAWDIVTM